MSVIPRLPFSHKRLIDEAALGPGFQVTPQ